MHRTLECDEIQDHIKQNWIESIYMSLQDVQPWSLIYGELNRQHKVESDRLVAVIIAEYLNDRAHHGWGKRDKTLTFSIKWCLQKGWINSNSLQQGRVLYFEDCPEHLASNSYHRTKIDYYVSFLEEKSLTA